MFYVEALNPPRSRNSCKVYRRYGRIFVKFSSMEKAHSPSLAKVSWRFWIIFKANIFSLTVFCYIGAEKNPIINLLALATGLYALVNTQIRYILILYIYRYAKFYNNTTPFGMYGSVYIYYTLFVIVPCTVNIIRAGNRWKFSELVLYICTFRCRWSSSIYYLTKSNEWGCAVLKVSKTETLRCDSATTAPVMLHLYIESIL